MPIHPDRAALARFSATDLDQPVVMLNLLRFAERTTGESGDAGGASLTGREAYAEYSRRVAPLLTEVGGEVLSAGGVVEALIVGEDDAHWDEVLVVRYPSRAAFLQMIRSDAYGAAVGYRTAALADSRLIATAPLPVTPVAAP